MAISSIRSAIISWGEFLARITDNNIVKPALWIASFTFVIGLFISLGMESLIEVIQDVWLSLLALILVIFLGIAADAIGTAAAAAKIIPFNAMAAKKVPGAIEAANLTRNADLVANLTADVVGDISGTLSGAMGASIVFTLATRFSLADTVLLGAAMTSLIAAVTVGGKTVGKRIAINHANSIILRLGQFLRWLDDHTGIKVLR